MNYPLQAVAFLTLLCGLNACSSTGKDAAKPKKSGPSFGSKVGSVTSNVFYGLLEIPYTILSIPTDILSDPSTMNALAQAVDSHQRASSMIDSAAYASNNSDSFATYAQQTDSPQTGEDGTGVNPRLMGDAGGEAGTDDGLLTPREAVVAFEKSEMEKVEAYKRWVLGRSSPTTGGGGSMTAPKGQATSHSHRVPAASEGTWQHVGDFDGVRVWWKHRRELRDQIESALKMENLNSYQVTIEFNASFIAADGSDYTESGQRFSMAPGATKTGNTGGLFYYVKDARRSSANAPQAGGILDMTVTPAG